MEHLEHRNRKHQGSYMPLDNAIHDRASVCADDTSLRGEDDATVNLNVLKLTVRR